MDTDFLLGKLPATDGYMKKGQKTQKNLEFRVKNKENRQKRVKIVFLGVDRDKSGRIGFFGSSGGTSGFGLQIGTVPTRSGRLASMLTPDFYLCLTA